MSIDYFGYLGARESYVFNEGEIAALYNFQEVKKSVDECTNKDGFLYPPIQKSFIIDPKTLENKEEVPRSERPALLHKLLPSHSIQIANCESKEENRKGASSFLIHLLGFLLGYRLQFHDWWVDGRIPIETNNGLDSTKETVEDFLSHCFIVWKGWEAKDQKSIINLLYMFSCSVHYEWDWERYLNNYMVFDGLWRLSRNLKHIKKEYSHSKRIGELCREYKIPYDPEISIKIVNLRNDLFHESLWDGGQPGSSGSQESTGSGLFMRNLSSRIIPALFAYNTPFVKTKWWTLGRFIFDKAV